MECAVGNKIFLYVIRYLVTVTVTIVLLIVYYTLETAVAQWLRCCARNRKVAGSIHKCAW